MPMLAAKPEALIKTVEGSAKKAMLLGVLLAVLGILAMASPFFTGVTFTIIVGAFLLVSGISEVFYAFKAHTLGKKIVVGLWGALGIFCGIAMFGHPIFGMVVLTWVVAIYFIMQGVMEILMSIQMRRKVGWGWSLFAGIVDLALGVMLLERWPISGLWAIGLFVGINIMMSGFTLLGFASATLAAAKQQQQPVVG